MTVSDLQAPAVRGSSGTVIKSELEKYGEGEIFEALDIDKFGNIFPVEISTSKIRFNGKDLVIGITRDISERNKANKQLEENLEYFAHLVDQIRNPLAILSGFTQVEIQNEKTRARILRQVERIEELIKKLDQGWLDTEETRKFLKRYMQ